MREDGKPRAKVIPALEKEGFESEINALQSLATDLPILKPIPLQPKQDDIQPLQSKQNHTVFKNASNKRIIKAADEKGTTAKEASQQERRIDQLEITMLDEEELRTLTNMTLVLRKSESHE
jgi:hypothetical protein